MTVCKDSVSTYILRIFNVPQTERRNESITLEILHSEFTKRWCINSTLNRGPILYDAARKVGDSSGTGMGGIKCKTQMDESILRWKYFQAEALFYESTIPLKIQLRYSATNKNDHVKFTYIFSALISQSKTKLTLFFSARTLQLHDWVPMFATFFHAINVNTGFIDTAMMNTSNALKN